MAIKPMGPLAIANLMGQAAHKKAQKPAPAPDQDGDDAASAPQAGPSSEDGGAPKKKLSPKQEAAIKEKNAGKKLVK